MCLCVCVFVCVCVCVRAKISNTVDSYIYWYNIKRFVYKVQLHVSTLDNGHLQVVHEILIKLLYKTYMIYVKQ